MAKPKFLARNYHIDLKDERHTLLTSKLLTCPTEHRKQLKLWQESAQDAPYRKPWVKAMQNAACRWPVQEESMGELLLRLTSVFAASRMPTVLRPDQHRQHLHDCLKMGCEVIPSSNPASQDIMSTDESVGKESDIKLQAEIFEKNFIVKHMKQKDLPTEDFVLEEPVMMQAAECKEAVPDVHSLVQRARRAKPSIPRDPFLDKDGHKITENCLFIRKEKAIDSVEESSATNQTHRISQGELFVMYNLNKVKKQDTELEEPILLSKEDEQVLSRETQQLGSSVPLVVENLENPKKESFSETELLKEFLQLMTPSVDEAARMFTRTKQTTSSEEEVTVKDVFPENSNIDKANQPISAEPMCVESPLPKNQLSKQEASLSSFSVAHLEKLQIPQEVKQSLEGILTEQLKEEIWKHEKFMEDTLLMRLDVPPVSNTVECVYDDMNHLDLCKAQCQLTKLSTTEEELSLAWDPFGRHVAVQYKVETFEVVDKGKQKWSKSFLPQVQYKEKFKRVDLKSFVKPVRRLKETITPVKRRKSPAKSSTVKSDGGQPGEKDDQIQTEYSKCDKAKHTDAATPGRILKTCVPNGIILPQVHPNEKQKGEQEIIVDHCDTNSNQLGEQLDSRKNKLQTQATVLRPNTEKKRLFASVYNHHHDLFDPMGTFFMMRNISMDKIKSTSTSQGEVIGRPFTNGNPAASSNQPLANDTVLKEQENLERTINRRGILAGDHDMSEDKDRDQPEFALIASQDIIRDSELLHLLESKFNITLVERDFQKVFGKNNQEADIIVDICTCVLLLPSVVMQDEQFTDAFVKRITWLRGRYKTCCIIIQLQHKHLQQYILTEKVVSNVTRLLAIVKHMREIDIMTLYAMNKVECAELIRHTADTAAKKLQDFKLGDWYKRNWLSPDMPIYEVFLMRIPSVNPMVAQLLLSRLTIKNLLCISSADMKETFPMIPQSFVKAFFHYMNKDVGLGLIEPLQQQENRQVQMGKLESPTAEVPGDTAPLTDEEVEHSLHGDEDAYKHDQSIKMGDSGGLDVAKAETEVDEPHRMEAHRIPFKQSTNSDMEGTDRIPSGHMNHSDVSHGIREKYVYDNQSRTRGDISYLEVGKYDKDVSPRTSSVEFSAYDQYHGHSYGPSHTKEERIGSYKPDLYHDPRNDTNYGIIGELDTQEKMKGYHSSKTELPYCGQLANDDHFPIYPLGSSQDLSQSSPQPNEYMMAVLQNAQVGRNTDTLYYIHDELSDTDEAASGSRVSDSISNNCTLQMSKTLANCNEDFAKFRLKCEYYPNQDFRQGYVPEGQSDIRQERNYASRKNVKLWTEFKDLPNRKKEQDAALSKLSAFPSFEGRCRNGQIHSQDCRDGRAAATQKLHFKPVPTRYMHDQQGICADHTNDPEMTSRSYRFPSFNSEGHFTPSVPADARVLQDRPTQSALSKEYQTENFKQQLIGKSLNIPRAQNDSDRFVNLCERRWEPRCSFPGQQKFRQRSRVHVGLAKPLQHDKASTTDACPPEGSARRKPEESPPMDLSPQSLQLLASSGGFRVPMSDAASHLGFWPRVDENQHPMFATETTKRRRLTYEKIPGKKGGQTRLSFM